MHNAGGNAGLDRMLGIEGALANVATCGLPRPAWHSCRCQTILEAGALLDKARSTKGKAQPHAIDWRRLQQLPDGYYLQWTKPVSFAAVYAMFNRLLG